MSIIKKKIEKLIIKDLVETGYHTKKEFVLNYRDTYFLNGHYDYLFLKYIKDNKL